MGSLTNCVREILGGLGNLLGSYVTRVLNTARINNVDSVVNVVNNERWYIFSSVNKDNDVMFILSQGWGKDGNI